MLNYFSRKDHIPGSFSDKMSCCALKSDSLNFLIDWISVFVPFLMSFYAMLLKMSAIMSSDD